MLIATLLCLVLQLPSATSAFPQTVPIGKYRQFVEITVAMSYRQERRVSALYCYVYALSHWTGLRFVTVRTACSTKDAALFTNDLEVTIIILLHSAMVSVNWPIC